MFGKDFTREALLVCITLIASMIGWFILEGQSYLNANEVERLIDQKQALVTLQIKQLTEATEELKRAIRENTEAINSLNIAIVQRE